MTIYKAPIRDMRFVLFELLCAQNSVGRLPDYEETTPDLVEAVLEEAGKLCETMMLPANPTGHMEGCRLENGEVTTPSGFKEAYRAYTEGGWQSLDCDPAYGGQGLPRYVYSMVDEMLCASNVAFSLYPGLTHGAYTGLVSHASDELKDRFLPNLVAGTWSGTMCLTEPQCGTDLGLIRTRAQPRGDGSYALSGVKIFITCGEHDLTENIVHLVLARLPDAPPGIKGVSLFVAPKLHVQDDGGLGERNGVKCASIEHKMGIHGSPTCVLHFDQATGYLVGEPHRGMRCMFTMMNSERLAVGIQGIGIAEAAYQNAVNYARERLQGRAANGVLYPDKSADPIIVHPDVRRMLLTSRAYVEGSRALGGWVATLLDIAKAHPEPEARQAAEDSVALLTPVVKAFFTDAGQETCNLCLQVFGGHGYIGETGMEQLVRDARITSIYEGANGVQALDLVGRKLPMHDGRPVKRFFMEVAEFIEDNRKHNALAEFIVPLEDALTRLRQVTWWVLERSAENREEIGAASSDYLRLFGLVALAYMWVRMVKTAQGALSGGDSAFYRAKIATGRFYVSRLLPQTMGLAEAIKSGSEPLMELDADAF